MRKTFNQLTCLYQFWRVKGVSAIWTFLESVALGRVSTLADMVTDETPVKISLLSMPKMVVDNRRERREDEEKSRRKVEEKWRIKD